MIPKVSWSIDNQTLLILGAFGALGVYLLYSGGKAVAGAAVEAAETVGEAVNPVSDQNIVYQGVSAVVDVVDDGQRNGATLGTWLYDITHPGE